MCIKLDIMIRHMWAFLTFQTKSC